MNKLIKQLLETFIDLVDMEEFETLYRKAYEYQVPASELTQVFMDAGIDILSKLTILPRGMFSNIANLTSITIPNNVTSISDYFCAFAYDLKHIEIPTSVVHIGDRAFMDCTQLTEINYTGTIQQWNAIDKDPLVFNDCFASQVICSDGVLKIDES